jgi:glycosyltransferase involved in cell wall biosynthesis
MIRVLYVIDKMGAGGAQTHLATLVRGLDPDRFEPVVVCLHRGGVSADRLLEAGFRVEVLRARRLYGAAGIAAFVRLVALMRRVRPHLVHTYLTSANVFGTAAACVAGVSHAITSRRDDGHADGTVMRRALAATNRYACRVVAVSRHAAAAALGREGLDRGRVSVIGNGIDLERFSPRGRREVVRAELGIGASTPVLLSVGHLTQVKGADVLVDAMVGVRAAFPGAVALVAGDGNVEAIRRRADELGLGGAVRLLGRRTDVPDLLEAADVFVLPSRSEGQPNALIEAMAMGVPAVATRVGGVPEIARDGRDAVLVEADDPAALARACASLLASPPRRQALSASASTRARSEFGVLSMARRYQALYQEVLAGEARALSTDEQGVGASAALPHAGERA